MTDRLCLATEDPSGRNPHPRLTVTYPVIDSARIAVFTVAGRREARGDRAAPRRRGPAGRPGWRRAEIRWLVDAGRVEGRSTDVSDRSATADR